MQEPYEIDFLFIIYFYYLPNLILISFPTFYIYWQKKTNQTWCLACINLVSKSTDRIRDAIKQELFHGERGDKEHDDDDDDDDNNESVFSDEIWKSEVIVIIKFMIYVTDFCPFDSKNS